MLKVEIIVYPKKGLLDPQSSAVLKTIKSHAKYQEITDISIGRHILLELKTNDREKAKVIVDDLCQNLLIQPMLEDYTFQINENDSLANMANIEKEIKGDE